MGLRSQPLKSKEVVYIPAQSLFVESITQALYEKICEKGIFDALSKDYSVRGVGDVFRFVEAFPMGPAVTRSVKIEKDEVNFADAISVWEPEIEESDFFYASGRWMLTPEFFDCISQYIDRRIYLLYEIDFSSGSCKLIS